MTEALVKSSRPEQLSSMRVLDHKPIAKNQWALWLKPEKGELPNFRPGNFCMITMPDYVDPLVPRPFAIVEKKADAYLFIYRVAGKFTRLLTKMPQGSRLDVLGPLGCGFSDEHLSENQNVFIAGGVGYASILPILEALALKGISPAAVYYGVREELEIIRRSPFKCEYASDDGSIGYHGRLTGLLEKQISVLEAASSIYVCGPTGMMKAVYDLCSQEKSYFFLEEAMGCGSGICMGCVVPVEDHREVRRVRSCLEGPVFRGDRLAAWRAL